MRYIIKKNIFKSFKELSIFLWLIALILVTFITYKIYENNRINRHNTLFSALNNSYLQKTIKEISNSLEKRYIHLNYITKKGDTYLSIINNLNINSNEKKLILSSIKNKKQLNILKTGQKFYFKIDKLNNAKVTLFKIQTDNKNEILFTRLQDKEKYKIKSIVKDLKKELVYKESTISSSLYSSAINSGIKPNIIIDFARLYGFQVDFQRDIWKDDSFQIIYEEFRDQKNNLIDTGNIIFANLNLQDTNYEMYRYQIKKGEYDYFDENGKSVRKTLMKTPINGARLSSSFGKRKHPILGYTKMHTGTDFAAPMGTPILASGDGEVVRAQWCGGGGNCVKIKHNRVYQTIYAHMSKFGKGIKKGAKVKQGQIIGYVGSTGLSTGPHLHYEVIENGRKINSQKLRLPSGKILKGEERKNFEVDKIKIDVLKSNLIAKIN